MSDPERSNGPPDAEEFRDSLEHETRKRWARLLRRDYAKIARVGVELTDLSRPLGPKGQVREDIRKALENSD